MSFLNDVAKLRLHPKSNPRDRRVHERIQEELEPLAEDIMREFRRGLTEEEILERARQREERRDKRQEAKDRAVRDTTESAQATRKEVGADKEVVERLAELTREGPIRWGEIRERLKAEGITWNQVRKLRDMRAFDIDSSAGGPTWIERAS